MAKTLSRLVSAVRACALSPSGFPALWPRCTRCSIALRRSRSTRRPASTRWLWSWPGSTNCKPCFTIAPLRETYTAELWSQRCEGPLVDTDQTPESPDTVKAGHRPVQVTASVVEMAADSAGELV